jgi:hypothetical protein
VAKALGVSPDDIFLALIPVPNENFSFGRGELQLAEGGERWGEWIHNIGRSTRMMAATWGCQSVAASFLVGSKTVTVRLSSRLRPLSWLWANPSGAVVAVISAICWRRVGWLSLT